MPEEYGFSPTGYTLERAHLIPFSEWENDSFEPEDISNFIYYFTFTQSLDNAAYSGSINVLDNQGMLEFFPLRGEERIKLKLVTSDTNTTIDLDLFVHDVNAIKPQDDTKGSAYTLSVVSYTSFLAAKRKVIEGFKLPASLMVRDIVNKYYDSIATGEATDTNNQVFPYAVKRHPFVKHENKSIYIQPTVGIMETVIPNLTPAKAIKFIAGRSWSGDEQASQSFRFFETWDAYNFVTDEFLVEANKDSPHKLHYTPGTGSQEPTEMENQIQRIENMQIISTGRTTSGAIDTGAYRLKVMEIDLVRGVVNNKNYDYLQDANFRDMAGEVDTEKKNLPHTKDYIEDTFTEENSKDFIVYKNYSGTGDLPGPLRGDAFFPEIIQRRVAYSNHLNTVVLGLQLKGRADLRPGHVCDIDIQALNASPDVKLSPQLSGRYLIKSVTHEFDMGTLKTSMQVAKFDWSS